MKSPPVVLFLSVVLTSALAIPSSGWGNSHAVEAHFDSNVVLPRDRLTAQFRAQPESDRNSDLRACAGHWNVMDSELIVEPAPPKKIVLIAGKKSHGPGAHDYERTMRLFKAMLDRSCVRDDVRVEVHETGWPADESTLDDADVIVFYSDGRDGTIGNDVPFVAPERMKVLERQMRRGCGMMTIHFSTFVTDEEGKKVLDWVGGHFDWQDDAGKRNWYSKINPGKILELADEKHPIARGVARAIALDDEVYWRMRFRPDDKRFVPIARVPELKDPEQTPHHDVVAWSVTRADGGRGFGTSLGHSYRLWQDADLRKFFLNAIVWTAGLEVPDRGVAAEFLSDDEVRKALDVGSQDGARRASEKEDRDRSSAPPSSSDAKQTKETDSPRSTPTPSDRRADGPRLERDVVVVVAGSSIGMNRYGCREIPEWTGGYDRVPPQMNGQNVFFRIWEMLNDHENMHWRRLTDADWTRHGDWKPEYDLPYKDACYGKRVSYAASDPAAWAELRIPAGYEKVDLIYSTDRAGDGIRVSIDGKAAERQPVVETLQETSIPDDRELGDAIETLDSHGGPRRLPRPTKGIMGIIEKRVRYQLDPAKPHRLRVQRATAEARRRILVWGAVYWRGNCVQVVQRSKGGINCGDLPNYHAIQEVLGVNPDYLLVEAINLRDRPETVGRILEPPLGWCAAQRDRFRTIVYATPMANSARFLDWFSDPQHGGYTAHAQADNAAACARTVERLCMKYELPFVDVGPTVDRWLADTPEAKLVPHVQADWYHPNQWGAALFASALHDGIRRHWSDLPIAPVNVPPLDKN